MHVLDKKDREILYHLDLDSRQPNSQIARKVHASKEVVGYRIGRMQDAGIIEGYYVLVDMTKLGFKNARIFFKFKSLSPQEEKRLVSQFSSNQNAWWVNSISGSVSDMGVAFWVKDVAEFQELKDRVLESCRGKVEFFRESFYSKFRIWRRHYLSPKQNHQGKGIEIEGSGKAAKYDQSDIRILCLLTENARMSIVEIAARANLSASVANYRIARLKKEGIILGFRPKINLSKIGYYWYKVEFQLEDYSAKKRMLDFFTSHPNIVYSYESIGGGTDMEIEMEVESHSHFRQVIDQIRLRFSGEIRTYIYYLWSAEHKIVFFPEEDFFKKQPKFPA